MELKWHGTAAIELTGEQGKILFDPFVPAKGAETDVSIEEFDSFSDIFVTHGHFDHIASIPEIVERNPDVTVYCTRAPYETLRKKGVPEKNLRELCFGQSVMVNGFLIHVLHGKHAVLPVGSPKRILYALGSPARGNLPGLLRDLSECRERGETVFYHIEAEGKTVSLMGSLNLRRGVRYPVRADLLVLPYNGWADNFAPVVRAVLRLKPKRVVLDHYDDTFPPLTMPLDITPILGRFRGTMTALERGKTERI